MSAPIAVRVTRYRCPFCARSHSSRGRAAEHIGRCWRNPEARGCKTCRHFDATYEDYGEDCDLGVDLAGRPQCEACGGMGYVGEWDIGHKCPACNGNPEPVKAGPIIHCDKWESAQRSAEGAPISEGDQQ